MLLGVARNVPGWEVEQRAQQPAEAEAPLRRHGGGAGESRPAQQREQHGLGLIGLVMGGQQQVAVLHVAGECRVTRSAGGSFDALAGRRTGIDAMNVERHIERRADCRAVRGPAGRVHVEAVVDVYRAQVVRSESLALARQPVQQGVGVAPAAVGDAQRDRRRSVRERREDQGKAGLAAHPSL
jgi:hypothetical protein